MVCRVIFLNVGVIALHILVASCALADERVFRLGVSCPLSGILAEYGMAVRNGIELARREDPHAFKSVQFIFEDSQWEPKVAVSAFRALQTQHKADLVFNWGNPTSEAVAPIAEQARVPTLVMSSDSKIAEGRRYIVRTINSAAQLGERLAREVTSRGYRSIGVVLADNSYVGGVIEGFRDALQTDHSVDIVARVALDTQDFRSVIAKMKTRNFDVLGVMLISGQISGFYRQMKALHLVKPSFGPDFLDSKNELVAAGGAVEGAFHPNFDVVDSFRVRYEKQFGNDAQIPFAANAYDVANVVARLFGREEKARPSPEGIIDRIRAIRDYSGANGTMTVVRGKGDDYYFEYPLVIKEARSGSSITLHK